MPYIGYRLDLASQFLTVFKLLLVGYDIGDVLDDAKCVDDVIVIIELE